ncbi:hypothetical protein [Yoonia sp. SS1-5]|uniref:Uncharacterized protein n=1 Tax=Yoonia rhodophyticola TaxID=3137370 RepID=A0AAN0NLY2_9RHOB
MGAEAGIEGAEFDGAHLFGGTPPAVDEFAGAEASNLTFALNFASGDLGQNQRRWIVSPYYSQAFDGASSENRGVISTDNPGGYFEWRELGVRVEHEMAINDTWSWTSGLRWARIDHEANLADESGNFLIKEMDGRRIGLSLGVNAAITDNIAAVSRLGYSWVDLDETAECTGPSADACTPSPAASADDTTELDGFDFGLSLRYTF